MKQRGQTPLFHLALLVLLAAGCSGGSEAQQVSEPAAQQGGTIRYPLTSDPRSITPLRARTRDELTVTRQLFQGLTDIDVDTGLPVPTAATTWEASDDLRTYTFTLRPGLRFGGDAGPVTADTFLRDWELVCERDAPGARLLEIVVECADGRLGGVRALGPRRLELQLDQPFAELPALVSSPSLWAFPPDRAATPAYERSPVGSGPFQLATWTPGVSLRLERNPAYAGAHPLVDAVELPVLDRIDVSASAMGAYRRDAVDVAPVPTSQLRLTMSDPGLAPQLQVLPQAALSVLAIDARIDHPQRTALAYGADPLAAAAVAGGADTVARSLIPEGVPGHDPGTSPYGYDPGRVTGVRSVTLASLPGARPGVAEALARGYASAGVRPRLVRRDGEATVVRLAAAYSSPDPFIARLAVSGEGAELLRRARATEDHRRRLELYDQAAGAILATARIVPLANEGLAVVVKSRVHRLRIDTLGLPRLEDCWLTGG